MLVLPKYLSIVKMLWSLFFVLYGDVILAILAALSVSFRNGNDSEIDPDASKFIKNLDFMLPENFLSRYPQEANPYRLKIYAYLIFNLLVKGYGSVDSGRFWEDYNRDDYKRILIDAVFYEYFTNFTDREDKDILFHPLKFPSFIDVVHPPDHTENNFPVTNEEIAVDRIGQYLDLLSENKPQQEKLKSAYEILSEKDVFPNVAESRTAECETHSAIPTLGVPGIDYPNFCDIPKTSFSCDHKKKPGIYADYETGCQVFHVCWPHRIDSFLCPIGTVFNQSLLTCDIWHDTHCYSSSMFANRRQFVVDGFSTESDIPSYDGSCESLLNKPLLLNIKFLPAECEIKHLKEGNHVETTKAREDASELGMRIETITNLFREMLELVREIRNDLADEMINRTPWIYALEKHLETRPTPEIETAEAALEITRKIGETRAKPKKVAKPIRYSKKLLCGVKHGIYRTPSTLLKPSKPLEVYLNSSRKKDVIKLLRLGGALLNDGVTLTKQVIKDSYRKIKPKKH